MAKPAKKRKRTEIIKIDKSRHMVITPVLRLSFPSLFTARSFEDNPKEKAEFRCDLIGTEADFKTPYKGKKAQTPSLRQAILNCKKDQWGEDKDDWPTFKYKEIHDGNDKQAENGDILDGYEDHFYIAPRSGEDYPPKLTLLNGQPASEDDIYGGCYVRAQIICRPYDTGSNQGVSLRLVSVMKVEDGEKFGVGSDLFDFEDEEEGDENWSEDDD